MGRGKAEGRGIRPCPHSFVLPHPRPALHDGKNFLTPSPPHEALSHLVKLYLICTMTSTIFLMKPISLIKIYLKLQLNLFHQIK